MTTHIEPLRVGWIDTDASGLIHFSAAMRYFEVAEFGLMRKLLGDAMRPGERSFGLPRVHVECDYKAALRFPDEFECAARVAAVGRTSVTYRFEAHRKSDGVLCLVGKIVAVAIGSEGSAIPLPDEFRSPLEKACAESEVGAPESELNSR
jgi:YbgC/YbaW family acyl-CoA thioester hydrolase